MAAYHAICRDPLAEIPTLEFCFNLMFEQNPKVDNHLEPCQAIG